MPIAHVNDADLYYEEHGTGAPLVLLHGGLQTIELGFGDALAEFAKNHRVIAIELQGHGRTPDTERPYALDDLAGDVVALLDHLGVERADVFGFSLGGLVAVQLGVRHPDRVGRLVLASAHVRPDGYHEGISTGTRTDLLPTEQDFADMAAAYRAVAPDPDHFGAFAAKVSALPPTVNWSDDELRAITAPALVLIGDTDFVRVEHAVLMRDLIPNAQLAVLPDTTHMGVPHNPATVPVIKRFLG
jgi:pimeloyl-ACP methyl ester carboxylesterase